MRLGSRDSVRLPPPARRKPDRSVGAVAFRTGDPATGDFGDAKFIRKFGDVSDDLSAL